jgi:hypothetical protein
MPLNKGQQAGFEEVIDFINTPDEKFMNISGGAGTGKTYTISQIADTILKHKGPDSRLHTVAITATTNKAAAVLSDAMPHRAGEIGTVYTYMNLRLQENFATGEAKIVPTNKFYVHSGVLLIVDEASMVNAKLFEYLQKGLDNTCKVIFVGDKNQLAPVKEPISPVYTNNFRTAYLTAAVRNAEQAALMDLCEQAKQTVLTGKFYPIREVPGVIDLVDGIELKGLLEREYTQEDPSKRVISYTNKRVMEYGGYIRQLRGYTQPFEVGEILSNNQSAELLGKTRLYTDQVVRVVRILSDREDDTIVRGHGLRVITLIVEDVNHLQKYEVTTFADPEERQQVLKHFANNKAWDKYFRIKNTYPDMRSISASTSHKAQGSTYQSVIVDLADIGKCTNVEQTARMQYVALSRPKSRIFIRGQLPDRYFQ